jgi:hypothetical protein
MERHLCHAGLNAVGARRVGNITLHQPKYCTCRAAGLEHNCGILEKFSDMPNIENVVFTVHPMC